VLQSPREITLCLVAGLAVLFGRAVEAGRPGARLGRSAAVWIIVASVFTVSSHTMLVRTSAIDGYRVAQLVAGQPLARLTWRGEGWALMPTTYVFNKLASWHAVTRRWPWGVGPAGQPASTETLRRERVYPAMITLTDPHSTYSGVAAELGVAGAAALLLLLGTVVVTLGRLARDRATPTWVIASYTGAGAAFLLEAIATDLMSCRHYWWLIAVVASRESLAPLSHAMPGPESSSRRVRAPRDARAPANRDSASADDSSA
jgi:hypothetical protein